MSQLIETLRNSEYAEEFARLFDAGQLVKTFNHPMITWQDGDDTYTAQYFLYVYGAHVICRGYYTKNGKKTTLKAIKSSYRRLTAAEPVSSNPDEDVFLRAD